MPGRRSVALVSASALLLAVGCAKDSPGPDVIPPSVPAALRVTAANDTTITLAWTAPGNDGDRGQAARYDLRVHPDTPAAPWDSAQAVEGLPAPQPAGQAESFTVGGLATNHVYVFALRAFDGAENASSFTDPVQGETGDPAPPGAVTDLRALDPQPHAVTLGFTAPGDDGAMGTAAAYVVRSSPDPITEATWPGADSLALAIPPRPGGDTVEVRITGLEPGTTAHYAVRARDDAEKEGPVSNDLEVDLPPDTVPPAGITDLAARPAGPYKVALTWTAPGNDGSEGRAASYEVRYAGAPITEATWEEATRATGTPPEPGPAGARDSMTVLVFEGGTPVWLAVRSLDEAGNQSGVSNGATVVPEGAAWTWAVRVDGTGDAPTIQAAIDSAADGDEVLVEPGTYYENLVIDGKQLTLRSSQGAEVTVIDGSGEDESVIRCLNGAGAEVTIEGFTITGGSGSKIRSSDISGYGGGILCIRYSPIIIHNIITGNRAVGSGAAGGGILTTHDGTGPEVWIEDNVIEHNQAQANGGGVVIAHLQRCSLIRNTIRDNRTAAGDGGGIYVNVPFTTLRIDQNTIAGNDAYDHGGGILLATSYPKRSVIEITNNLIVNNHSRGLDAYVLVHDCRGGGIWLSGSGHVAGNTFAFNSADTPFVYPDAGCVCLLDSTPLMTLVERNIIYKNNGGGVSTYAFNGDPYQATLRDNLIYANTDNPISVTNSNYTLDQEGNLFVDPLFCEDDAGTDGSLATTSPALTHPGGVIGAIPTPGCSDSTRTLSTWSRIRAQYGSSR